MFPNMMQFLLVFILFFIVLFNWFPIFCLIYLSYCYHPLPHLFFR